MFFKIKFTLLMRKEDIKNKIANNYKILAAIHIYRNDFLKKLGSEEALNQYIDKVLDSINENEKRLKKLNDE